MSSEGCQICGGLLHQLEDLTLPLAVHAASGAQALQVSAKVLQHPLKAVHRKWKEERGRLLDRVPVLLDLPGAELRRAGNGLAGEYQRELERLHGIDSIDGPVELPRKPGDADPAAPVSRTAYRSADLEHDRAGTADRRAPRVATMRDAPPERHGWWTGARTTRFHPCGSP